MANLQMRLSCSISVFLALHSYLSAHSTSDTQGVHFASPPSLPVPSGERCYSLTVHYTDAAGSRANSPSAAFDSQRFPVQPQLKHSAPITT